MTSPMDIPMKHRLRHISSRMLIVASFALLPGQPSAAPARRTIAILSMTTPSGDSVSGTTLSDILADELAKTGTFNVMERTNIQPLLSKAGFADSSSCETGACATQAGTILSTDEVVIGSVGRVGDAYMISARRIETPTGKVLRSARILQRGALDAVIAYAVPRIASDLTAITPNAPSPFPQNTPAAVQKSANAPQDDIWGRRHRGFHPRFELLIGYPDAIEAPLSVRMGAEYDGFGASIGSGAVLPLFVYFNNDPRLQSVVPSITTWYAWKYLQFELSYAYASFRSTWGNPSDPSLHEDKYFLSSWSANTRFDVGEPGNLAIYLGGSALVVHREDGDAKSSGLLPMINFGIALSN